MSGWADVVNPWKITIIIIIIIIIIKSIGC